MLSSSVFKTDPRNVQYRFSQVSVCDAVAVVARGFEKSRRWFENTRIWPSNDLQRHERVIGRYSIAPFSKAILGTLLLASNDVSSVSPLRY